MPEFVLTILVSMRLYLHLGMGKYKTGGQSEGFVQKKPPVKERQIEFSLSVFTLLILLWITSKEINSSLVFYKKKSLA